MTDVLPAPTSTLSTSAGQDYSAALYLFLDKLSPSMFARLYESPASCLSIFRLLPQTARHVILNTLWYNEPLTLPSLQLWVRERKSESGSSVSTANGERKHLNMVLEALARLHIMSVLTARNGAGREGQVKVNEKFKENFKRALTGGGNHGSFGVPSEDTDMTPTSIDVPFLDEYAEKQWETILHYMVGSAHSSSLKPSEIVLRLLAQAGLMSSPSGTLKNLSITSKGFQFLLDEVNTQLWDFLLVYLENANDTVKVLGFLFMLGSLELGRAYSSASFDETELQVLLDLSDYGLIYLPPSPSTNFYPTRLATTLTSSAPPLVSSKYANEDLGFLIIETNFKIYAYTSNPLQIAVLDLFVSLKSRFPNFLTGVITRDSIKNGLEKGITAEQILTYLSSRAHPQMRKKLPLIPNTIADQIRLWEREGLRVKHEEGYLYDDFGSQGDYDLVLDYAMSLGVVSWELKERRKFFVSTEGHAQVREFIKRRMAAAR